MQPDVRELSKFYQTRLGEMTRLCISRRLGALWPDLSGRDVLSLGYGSALLPMWDGQPRRLVNAMPSRQGVEQWPATGPVQSTLVDPLSLPFAENSFDRILITHCLEEVSDPSRFLQQTTRALAAGGRLALIVPHRMGLWSASASSPFGHGRAYSNFQLSQLLEQAGLKPTARTQALFAPPHNWFAAPTGVRAWERTGEVFWPFFGGVLLVEAQKVRMIDPRARQIRPVFCPEPPS